MNREKDTAATEEAWDHFNDRDISILQSFQRAFRQWEAERTIPVPEYLRDDLKRFNAWMPKIISALTVNTSTPGNDLEYNGLAATRMEELERRTLKLELAVSALMEGKND